MRAWSLENVLLSYYYRNHKMIIICSLRKSRGGSQSSQGSVPFSSATPLSAKKLGNQFFNVWLRHEAVIENPWIDRSWMLSSWIIILPLDLEILHSKNQLKNGSTFQLTPYYRNWQLTLKSKYLNYQTGDWNNIDQHLIVKCFVFTSLLKKIKFK